MQIEEAALEHLATVVDANSVMFSDLLDSLQPARYREVTAAERPAVAVALQACLRSSNGERRQSLPGFPSILVPAADTAHHACASMHACMSLPVHEIDQFLLRL